MSSVSHFPVGELTRSLTVDSGAASIQGTDREQNEDCFVVDSAARFFVLADGIGGSFGGDIASRLACETLQQELQQFPTKVRRTDRFEQGAESALADNVPIRADSTAERGSSGLSTLSVEAFTEEDEQWICSQLLQAAKAANDRIVFERQRSWLRSHMGTTLVAAAIRDTQLYLVSMGDSRALLIREGIVRQLTRDHTMTAGLVEAGLLTPEEAPLHRYRNVLYKSLGSWTDSDPADVDRISLQAGDCIVLATDGLTDFVQNPEIAQVFENSVSPAVAAETLTSLAVRNGSRDDATCIVINISSPWAAGEASVDAD